MVPQRPLNKEEQELYDAWVRFKAKTNDLLHFHRMARLSLASSAELLHVANENTVVRVCAQVEVVGKHPLVQSWVNKNGKTHIEFLSTYNDPYFGQSACLTLRGFRNMIVHNNGVFDDFFQNQQADNQTQDYYEDFCKRAKINPHTIGDTLCLSVEQPPVLKVLLEDTCEYVLKVIIDLLNDAKNPD